MLQHDGPDTGASVSGGIVLLLVAGGTVAGATQTDEAGPILAFVGALLVVLITALTTDRRQRRQLAVQSDGLRTQLGHDRKLADQQHLRELLDSCAKAAVESETSCIAFAVALDGDPGPEDAPNREARDERATSYSDALEAIRTLRFEARRLEMRYAREHPVCATFLAVRDALDARFTFLRTLGADVVINSEQDAHDSMLAAGAMGAFDEFASAVRTSIGAYVEGESEPDE